EKRERTPVQLHPEQQRETISNDPLRECADASGKTFAEHQCCAWCRAGEKFLHDAEVAFPDDIDAIKNRHEENALRENTGRDKVEIGNVARVHHPAAGEYLTEDEQPKRGLESARDKFGEIVAQLAQLKFGDDKRLLDETCQRMNESCGGHGLCGLPKFVSDSGVEAG